MQDIKIQEEGENKKEALIPFVAENIVVAGFRNGTDEISEHSPEQQIT